MFQVKNAKKSSVFVNFSGVYKNAVWWYNLFRNYLGDMELTVKNNNRKRRRTLAVIAVSAAALLIAAAVLYFILSRAANKDIETDYEFSEPDYGLTLEDILAEPEYAELERNITYTNEFGESILISDGDYLKYGIGVKLLAYYFEAIQAGDAVTFNSLFSDEYRRVNGDRPDFTPQRVYDQTVRLLYAEHADNDDVYRYEIGYKILKNDGTFNRLIGSDMSRPQFLTVRATADDVYIESVETQGKR